MENGTRPPMVYFNAIFLSIFLTFPAMAVSKDSSIDPALVEKIKPSLVHIMPTNEADQKRLPLGCTGFYVKREIADDHLIVIEESNLILTNLSCLIGPEGLNKPEPSLEIIGATLEDTQGRLFSKYTVIGYHQIANLALIKVGKDETKQTEKIVPVALNLTRPLGQSEKLYSIRYPSAASENDVLESTLEKSFVANFGDVSISYLMHQGSGLLNGFEGSPIINQKGEVVGINSYSNFYFFNIGYDLASLITAKNPAKPLLTNMSMSGDVKTDQYVMSMQNGDQSIFDNDAYDEALFLHRAMQMSKIDDLLTMFRQTLMVKISKDPLARSSSPETRLFYFQALDYMMDVIFEEFMVEIEKIKHAPIDDTKRSKQMNQAAAKLSDYFDVLKVIKKNLRVPLLSSNSYLEGYQTKIDCLVDSFKLHTNHTIAMPKELGVMDESVVVQSCDAYLGFMSKHQKDNFRRLKDEPYGADNLKHILELQQQFFIGN
jgi:hypothetical protein